DGHRLAAARERRDHAGRVAGANPGSERALAVLEVDPRRGERGSVEGLQGLEPAGERLGAFARRARDVLPRAHATRTDPCLAREETDVDPSAFDRRDAAVPAFEDVKLDAAADARAARRSIRRGAKAVMTLEARESPSKPAFSVGSCDSLARAKKR